MVNNPIAYVRRRAAKSSFLVEYVMTTISAKNASKRLIGTLRVLMDHLITFRHWFSWILIIFRFSVDTVRCRRCSKEQPVSQVHDAAFLVRIRYFTDWVWNIPELHRVRYIIWGLLLPHLPTLRSQKQSMFFGGLFSRILWQIVNLMWQIVNLIFRDSTIVVTVDYVVLAGGTSFDTARHAACVIHWMHSQNINAWSRPWKAIARYIWRSVTVCLLAIAKPWRFAVNIFIRPPKPTTCPIADMCFIDIAWSKWVPDHTTHTPWSI